jgi:hypothetical protein
MVCAPHKMIRVIKSRTMRLAGHGHVGGQDRCVQGFGGETLGKETTWKTWA